MKQYSLVVFAVAFVCLLLSPRPAAAQFELLWQVGDDDSGNADFVQEDGQANEPPGDPNARDDDWYFPGVYPDPVGDLPDGSPLTGDLERAFVPSDNNLRLHFNLPDDLSPSDRFIFTTDAINLEETGEGITDPRYGIEVNFNGVNIIPMMVIRADAFNQGIASEPFTAAEVGAVGGPGADNVVELVGTPFNEEGGGRWMGFDFHRLEIEKGAEPAPTPTMSEIGLLVLALGLMQIGVLVIRRRRAARGTA
jgi:hypothetical protein